MAGRLADVARYVGVSQSTVSRVLNGKPGISDATRSAVLTAVDVLGYERPAKLRGERARLVGIVLPQMRSPVFPAFAEVVAGALAKRGFSSVLCTNTVDGVSESDCVDLLLDQQLSGVIFAGGLYQQTGARHDHYARLRERSLPAVMLNAAVDRLAFPRVSTDEHHAVDQAYRHLAGLGHERIGIILGPPGHVPSDRKLSAYRAVGSSDLVAHANFSVEEGHVAAERLIGAGATALICASEALAIGAVRAARRLRLDVPADISVVGFDDAAPLAFTDPPLTTVRQPVAAMGQAAVSLLIGQIEAEEIPDDELLFEPELVVRASTGPCQRRGK